jgi:hypothetical protein
MPALWEQTSRLQSPDPGLKMRRETVGLRPYRLKKHHRRDAGDRASGGGRPRCQEGGSLVGHHQSPYQRGKREVDARLRLEQKPVGPGGPER